MILVHELPAQHNMPVQNTAGRVRDGLVEIIPVHQHGVQTGDGTFIRTPGPL